MRATDNLPDELTVRQTIAERLREVRLLRSIERALARYRKENDAVRTLREANPSADCGQEVARG